MVLGHDVSAKPTGHSGKAFLTMKNSTFLTLAAYRLIVKTSALEEEKDFCDIIAPRQAFTAMIMGYDRRMIMGPARNGEVYSMVAMVPDKNADLELNSWTTKADIDELRHAFDIFPEWSKAPFKHCQDIGLWQLRDIDPLPTWYRGRLILIGDAAHAMLPTQGQGASQSVEDAEALGAFFKDIGGKPSKGEVEERIKKVFECRYDRASLIQGYSRQAAQNATDKGDTKIKMSPAEFMDYNCMYNGALDWMARRETANKGLINGISALRI